MWGRKKTQQESFKVLCCKCGKVFDVEVTETVNFNNEIVCKCKACNAFNALDKDGIREVLA